MNPPNNLMPLIDIKDGNSPFSHHNKEVLKIKSIKKMKDELNK
jgi:hypothetical protein